VAFSLDGTADLPAQPDPFVPVPIEADFDVDSELAMVGAQIYGQRCGICHGSGAVAGGLTPDLRASLLVPQLEAFASVVRDGVKAVSGMPAYVDITFDELTALQHYIRQTAETALAAMEESGPR
jgi:quinohemoprotein ethanol dehydrogenase